MFRSLHMKLVLIMVLLIISQMTVVGAFLMNAVVRYYLDDFNIIGWTRAGREDAPGSGCAVLLSDGPGGAKEMCMGAQFAGRTFVDLLGNCPGEVTLDETGSAQFSVNGGSVSVWGPKG